MSTLPFVVISNRTGNTVAAFLLLEHAHEYAKKLETEEGPHGPTYEVLYKTEV